MLNTVDFFVANVSDIAENQFKADTKIILFRAPSFSYAHKIWNL